MRITEILNLPVEEQDAHFRKNRAVGINQWLLYEVDSKHIEEMMRIRIMYRPRLQLQLKGS